jgi:flagellar biosynthesis/type III secretory pathway protein FliH
MRAQVEELKGRIERQSVELAFEIAAKVIGAHIEAQPETVSKMVKDAVAQLVDVSRITIRVHPDDLDLIRGAAKKWYQDGDISTQAEIRPDSSLARGDSMIESERGITDARVSSQIARLQREAHNES